MGSDRAKELVRGGVYRIARVFRRLAALSRRRGAGAVAWLAEFDDENDLESLKHDFAFAAGVIMVGTLGALATVNSRIKTLLDDAAVGIAIGVGTILFLWGLEALRNRVTLP
jgi:hypothetical protein